MNIPSKRAENYRAFIEFVRSDIQRERMQVNRRMFGVVLWCFGLPVAVSFVMLLLISLGVLPKSMRVSLSWIFLIFPIIYSLYFLGSEVLVEVPTAFRRGGLSTTLGQAFKEGDWRARVAREMDATLTNAGIQDWSWIIANFRMDLELILYRTRYLTALGGAVFFLIMRGFDFLGDSSEEALHQFEQLTLTDFSQYIGLALFLMLLYLSGNRTHQFLMRYLNCAELVSIGKPRDPE